MCLNPNPKTLIYPRKKLRSLDVALLTAGTRLRGDFEERLRLLLEDVDQEGAPAMSGIKFNVCKALLGLGWEVVFGEGGLRPNLGSG